jgi:hypothetical protein
MSVAFRRDSDEEHKEPRFELPLPPGPNLVTQRGYDLIKARTEELEAAVPTAANDEQRAELQRDMRYWRIRLATAQVAPVPSGDAVAFGTRGSRSGRGRHCAPGSCCPNSFGRTRVSPVERDLLVPERTGV